MAGSVIIVGAGVIGSAIAYQLAKTGWDVTVISAGKPAATSASFGWINASFFLDDDHHRLRAEGIAAWHRLEGGLSLDVEWSGCLCFDQPPDELAQTYARLRGHGYAVDWLDRDKIAARVPALREPPEVALYFPDEGAAPSVNLPGRLLSEAQAHGARIMQDVSVTRVIRSSDGQAGVETPFGTFNADQVVLAAGVGTAALARSVGGHVPLVPRPAYIMRTAAVSPVLRSVVATPIGEIRQEDTGQLLMPLAVNHQTDTATELVETPAQAADDAMIRLRALLDGLDDITWAEVIAAERPVPSDGFPVLGYIADGIYAACLHSGITLGPVVAELVSKEISGSLDNTGGAMLAPYRPDRFAK